MKISAISNNRNLFKHIRYAVAIAGLSFAYTRANSQDIFASQANTISAKGSYITDTLNTPNPSFNLAGEKVTASIVVDLNKNILYLYNDLGTPQKAYRVASGKNSTPTNNGIRKIVTIEKYPYKSASKATKRYNSPNIYGSRVIVLCPVDTTNNKIMENDGQFIHGTNNPSSLGQHISMGCIRMDNDAVREVANIVKDGQYVSFID